LNCIAQNDCVDAIIVCGNTGFVGLTASGVGIQEIGVNACNSEENNSIWLKLLINNGGTLGFVLTPESTDLIEDFDFWIFGPNVTCDALGQAIRCSTTNPLASNQLDNLTGMNATEIDVSEGPSELGNSFINWLTVGSGEIYYIIIDRPHGFSNFSIQWTGTATFFEQPTIPNVNLNIQECDHDLVQDFSTEFNLNQNNSLVIGTQTGLDVTYHLNSNDAITGQNSIANPANFINTTNPQPLFVRLTNTVTGCFDTAEFSVFANNSVLIPINSFTICDDASDGNGTNGRTIFNLNDVTNSLFAGQDTAGLSINYYATAFNAINNIASFSSNYYNFVPFQEIVFIKVTTSSGCETIKEITINVNPQPGIINTALVQCDSGLNPDGVSLFNLNESLAVLTNNNPNLSVSFFENGNPIPLNSNYQNTSNPQLITAKITNTITGCSSISNLNLIVIY
jgi:hypothetical protein